MGLIRESMKIKKIFFGIGIHSTRWKHAGFMSLPYTWSEEQSGLQTGNIPVSMFQIILRMFRIIMNTITMNGAGKLLPVFLPICADWWMPIIADADGFSEYIAGNLPYQQRTGKIARKDFNRIEPRFRIESKDRETSIKALEDSVNGRSVPPLETMKVD